ncbi:serine/threonine-protein kinase [Nannocystis sp. RBIL2]|uniref:serine/threonine-protein kinase n=1 Tax=Nannocystis sp. RBIL2 TaxID=2996788 RepID=UPI0022707928|nr:serine/threonine-protein kinase [Nannocystis sp. RBIL2]MCY1065270.1 serine/threonine-protein kinase [Nannocystis sp. RBIL2]
MSETSADPALIGPFGVLRKLGEGAMGVVFEGYDARLERKVALKLVRRQLLNNPAVRERMTREAQAMARLSSPNVVQVYQVGEHDGGIYLAMEYIEGQTLATWLRAEARPWQQVLRTICDAGRGLAAAHTAGLVHRDFKPDNVLVDDRGRARVLDFGLVQAEGGPDDSARAALLEQELVDTEQGMRSPQSTHPSPGTSAPDRSSNLHWSVRLTQMGNTLGTPAYMSPEQHFGRVASPLADQFSFSVTLYEALYGARPFTGDSWAAIREAVRHGVVPPPPLESQVPRRVFKVLVRGLEIDPAKRWPSMAAMIEALEYDPWRVRARVAATTALIGAASLASYAVAVTRAEDGQRCQVSGEQLVGVWDPAREAAVARAFAATHLPFATDTARRVQSRIDAYARAWVAERQAACEDRASGAQTDHLADLRVACLDRRKAHLSALVDVFAAANNAVVENAVQAATALPSLATCADASGLLSFVLPDDPAVAERVTALRGDLAHADVFDRTGRYEEGLTLARRTREEATGLGYAPLDAEAALVEGRVLMNLVRGEEAEAALQRATRLGIRHDLHATAAEAATVRMFVLGNHLGRPAEALATAPFAESLIQRAGDDAALRVLFHNNVGTSHQNRGELAAARGEYEQALARLRQRGEREPFEAIVHNNLGLMHLEQGQLEAAWTHFISSSELFVAILGEHHPLLAHPIHGLGDVEVRRGRHLDAIPHYLRSLALMEATYDAEHRYLLYPLVGLGHAYAGAGKVEQAEHDYSRALRVAEANGVRDNFLAEAHAGLGELAARAGSPAKARRAFEQAAAVYAEVGAGDSEPGARAALRAGELAAAQGERAAARRWFEQVLATKSEAAAPLRAQASVLLQRNGT